MELGKGHEELGFSSPSPFLLDTGVCRQALWIGGRLPVRQLAACCPLLLAVQVAAQGWGALTGSVVGVDSVPLANARIQIAGTGPTVLSGRDGRFVLTGVSPGIHVIEVQLLGYLRVLQPVEVGQGETVALHIVLTLAPVPLEGVAVEAEAGRLPAMRGFEGRRATGNAGSANVVDANASRNPFSAGSIRGEWNAPLTGNRTARFAPASFASCITRSTPLTSPETTICSSVL